MDSKYWGPPAWVFLKSIAMGYTLQYDALIKDIRDLPYDEQAARVQGLQEDYYDFFISLAKVLPCKWCRKSYPAFLKRVLEVGFRDLPSEGNPYPLLYMVYLLKDMVNHKLAKQGREAIRDAGPDAEHHHKYREWVGCIRKEQSPPYEEVIQEMLEHLA
ncbi:uncharacterized protein BJ171DRAFT_589747 [Polychytrium aggregatum]|uniref:uncharacterized protein n=1 Tax=Polychytrium aggregatum TaxID=110093 RepID=UPI0022FEBBAD|nr:uncharacterized protein BJ171DRAFT_589747 [Polychytrium aggregatum]KAI9193022.1 hypothetical protein BJ171DRAFT_589747 [Polychytrium aggregatum]